MLIFSSFVFSKPRLHRFHTPILHIPMGSKTPAIFFYFVLYNQYLFQYTSSMPPDLLQSMLPLQPYPCHQYNSKYIFPKTPRVYSNSFIPPTFYPIKIICFYPCFPSPTRRHYIPLWSLRFFYHHIFLYFLSNWIVQIEYKFEDYSSS